MNKVFKIVFNKVLGKYVVVSEVAKTKGTHAASIVKKTGAVLISAAGLLYGTSFAVADDIPELSGEVNQQITSSYTLTGDTTITYQGASTVNVPSFQTITLSGSDGVKPSLTITGDYPSDNPFASTLYVSNSYNGGRTPGLLKISNLSKLSVSALSASGAAISSAGADCHFVFSDIDDVEIYGKTRAILGNRYNPISIQANNSINIKSDEQQAIYLFVGGYVAPVVSLEAPIVNITSENNSAVYAETQRKSTAATLKIMADEVSIKAGGYYGLAGNNGTLHAYINATKSVDINARSVGIYTVFNDNGENDTSEVKILAGTEDNPGTVNISSDIGEAIIAARGSRGNAVTVNSTGAINIEGNIRVGMTGLDETVTGNNAVVNINNGYTDSDDVFHEGTATVTINGDIKTGNNEETNGNTVNLSLVTSDSYLKGAIVDFDTSVEGGTNLVMSNGAVWNVTEAQVPDRDENGDIIRDEDGNRVYKTVSNTVKSINANNAVINVGTNELTVVDLVSDTNDTGIHIDGSENQLTISNHSTVNDGSTTIYTKTATADQASIENNNLVSMTEKQNSVLSGLRDISTNNFLAFRSQMNDLDKRMGDLRTMPSTDGAWARIIAGQSEYKSTHNTHQTLQIGGDRRIGDFLVGGALSYTDGNGSLKNGSTDDKAYSFGIYGSWLGQDGQFADVILKHHHQETDYDLRYTNGTKAKGSYDTSGTSISAEYGWRLGIANTDYYVEPLVEFMYGHMNSVGYKTSNGVKVSQDAIKAAVGRLGVAAGWVSPDKTGSAYVKASVLNDWAGNARVKASKSGITRRFHEDMGGTWGEFALGGTLNINKHLSAYGEMETTVGNPVRTTYQFSAGIRYSF